MAPTWGVFICGWKELWDQEKFREIVATPVPIWEDNPEPPFEGIKGEEDRKKVREFVLMVQAEKRKEAKETIKGE